LAASYQLAVVWTADLYLPELLGAALLNRDSYDLQASCPVRA
jgi:hypothetical protein